MTAQFTGQALPSQVLEPLCKPFAKQADWLLDLHAMTREDGTLQRRPGQCLRCFYELLSAASPEKEGALKPLKTWLEENLEITVSPGDGLEAEPGWAGEGAAATLPVRLEAPDLESFCTGAMRRVYEARLLEAENLKLEVRFKRAQAVA